MSDYLPAGSPFHYSNGAIPQQQATPHPQASQPPSTYNGHLAVYPLSRGGTNNYGDGSSVPQGQRVTLTHDQQEFNEAIDPSSRGPIYYTSIPTALPSMSTSHCLPSQFQLHPTASEGPYLDSFPSPHLDYQLARINVPAGHSQIDRSHQQLAPDHQIVQRESFPPTLQVPISTMFQLPEPAPTTLPVQKIPTNLSAPTNKTKYSKTTQKSKQPAKPKKQKKTREFLDSASKPTETPTNQISIQISTLDTETDSPEIPPSAPQNTLQSTPAAPTNRESIQQFLASISAPPTRACISPATMAEYWEKTVDELRQIAHSNSKKVMTKDDTTFLLHLEEMHQKEMALAAIQRQVSMPMIENMMGKKQSQRCTTSWNNFQKENGDIFKGAGKGVGVKGSGGMGTLSVKWNAIDPEERKAYKPENYNNHGQNDSPTEEVSGLRAQPQSLRRAEQRVTKWMDDWLKKATHIAATNHCEIVMFAVSNHLSAHNFQEVRATRGASNFVEEINKIDGLQNFESRLQAFITGARINNVVAVAKKKRKCYAADDVSEARECLDELVDRETGGIKNAWSWAECDKKLGELGFKVVLMPGASSRIEWLKSYSNRLTQAQARLIKDDLKKKLIRVVKDQDVLLGATRVIPDKSNRPARHPINIDNSSKGNSPNASPVDNQACRQPVSQPARKKPTKRVRKMTSTNTGKSPAKRSRVSRLTKEELALDESDSDSQPQRDISLPPAEPPSKRCRPNSNFGPAQSKQKSVCRKYHPSGLTRRETLGCDSTAVHPQSQPATARPLTQPTHASPVQKQMSAALSENTSSEEDGSREYSPLWEIPPAPVPRFDFPSDEDEQTANWSFDHRMTYFYPDS